MTHRERSIMNEQQDEVVVWHDESIEYRMLPLATYRHDAPDVLTAAGEDGWRLVSTTPLRVGDPAKRPTEHLVFYRVTPIQSSRKENAMTILEICPIDSTHWEVNPAAPTTCPACEARTDWECAPDAHDWRRMPPGKAIAGRWSTGYRFCTVCDRQEYDSGAVQPGWRNFR